jgi:hypothetical protein
MSDLSALAKYDGQRTVDEFRRSAVPATTSAPGFQMKLTPRISGCSVRTKRPTRHSGRPARTRRSQNSATICGGLDADLAPSMSQSEMFLSSVAIMGSAFAAQVGETSRRDEGFSNGLQGAIANGSRECAPDDRLRVLRRIAKRHRSQTFAFRQTSLLADYAALIRPTRASITDTSVYSLRLEVLRALPAATPSNVSFTY